MVRILWQWFTINCHRTLSCLVCPGALRRSTPMRWGFFCVPFSVVRIIFIDCGPKTTTNHWKAERGVTHWVPVWDCDHCILPLPGSASVGSVPGSSLATGFPCGVLFAVIWLGPEWFGLSLASAREGGKVNGAQFKKQLERNKNRSVANCGLLVAGTCYNLCEDILLAAVFGGDGWIWIIASIFFAESACWNWCRFYIV